MTVWSMYDPTTGFFTGRVISGDEEQLTKIQDRTGHLGMVGVWNSSQHRVDIGASPMTVVDYQPPQPVDDEDKVWSWDADKLIWRFTATLVSAKKHQWAGVKAAAEATNQTDITIGGKSYTATDAARASLYQQVQIAQMAVADGLPFSVDVILADDETVVTLNANQIKAGVRALHDREEQIKAKARTLRSAIFSATTSAEVVAVVWTWP